MGIRKTVVHGLTRMNTDRECGYYRLFWGFAGGGTRPPTLLLKIGYKALQINYEDGLNVPKNNRLYYDAHC